ncbi:MAG TPA: LamG domain-containing protein [Kiritimatiellia bacterium]|nr:LamG domain-containing protein [Kiritimatiellia bacterium]
MRRQATLLWTALSVGLFMDAAAAENGLVAHFTFDNPTQFGYDNVQQAVIGTITSDSISGATPADPTSCDAPIVRGMQIATGWWQNNYMTVPGASFGSAQGIPYGNQAVTYSLWIKPSPNWQTSGTLGMGTGCYLLRHCTAGHEWYKTYDHECLYIIRDGSGFPTITFSVGEYNAAAASATYALGAAFDGGWHLITATYENRVLKLYWDGVKRAETTIAANVGVPNNSPLMFGHAAVDYNTYVQRRFAGAVDDIKVYNRALDADEILAAYNAGATAFDTDVIVWKGASAGGAAEDGDNWSTKSNRRTVGEVYTAGAVFDVTAVTDDGTITHNADTTLKLKGVICTNGQDGVTIRMQAGDIEMKRPSTQRGLVAHFAFDDPDNMYCDLSTNAFTATPGAGVAYGSANPVPLSGCAGITGNGLNFVNGWWLFDYLTVSGSCFNAAHGIPYGNQAVSYSFWIKPTPTWRDYQHLGLGHNGVYLLRHGENLCQWMDNRGHSFWIFKDGDNPKITWSAANGGAAAARTAAYTSTELFDGAWHQIAGTYEDKVLKLYFDGELKATTTVPDNLTVANNSSLIVGADGLTNMDHSVQRTYAGGFDELKVFNVALTDAEVAAEYAQRSRNLDKVPAGTVPSPAKVQLDAGTSVAVRGYGHQYGSLTGAGSVDVGYTSALTLDGTFAVAGALTGGGEISAANLVLGGNASGFTGDFTLGENATVTITDSSDTFLNSTFGGKVTLPKKAVIAYGGKRPNGGMATLTAATLGTPSDFTEWVDSTGGSVKVRAVDDTLQIQVIGGLVLYVR